MSRAAYYYPQKMGRIILQSMEEVMGRNGVNTVLHLASLDSLIDNYPPASTERRFPFSSVSRLQSAMEQAFGLQAGHGLALRIGRAAFKNGIKEYGSLLGVTEPTFRLLPFTTKLRTGLNLFAGLFNKNTDQRVKVEEESRQILWNIERCPLCWERKAEEPVCHLAVGLLEESLYWLSGGKVFNIKETACFACGDRACIIVIDREWVA
jgi:predicted hydrocarbon binding protein